MIDRLRSFAMAAGLLLATTCAAQTVAWDALAPAERDQLAAWREPWPKLQPEQQQRLLRNARHWLGLSEGERLALQHRVDAWNTLPAAERARIREHAAAFERLGPQERAALEASYRRAQTMAPVERDALRQEFEQLGPSERRTLLIGEAERELASVAQQAFAFVPSEEQPATLDMLRGLAPGDRTRLATLARRIGPEARSQLRRELLALSREQRSAYLRKRLGET